MKKTVVSFMILVGLVGCSSQGESNNELKGEIVSNQIEQNNNENETNEMESMTFVYGKVKKVIGNEVELSLANNPFAGEFEEGEEGEVIEGGMVVESITMSEAAQPAGDQETIIAPMEGMELDYTGEDKSYTIPTGISITNYLTYGEGSLTDIKEGSIICLGIVGSGETEDIQMIDILE